MMQHSNHDDTNELEFTTSIDQSIKQNVPIPAPTNSVLQNMINSQSSQQTTPSGSIQPSPSPSSSYKPTLPGLSFLTHSTHPTACLFHLLFKAAAFALYLLGSKFMEDIMVTVICILFNAADFWVVKNITGRVLVGLRWWNKVDPVTGATSWIFESAAPTSEAGSRGMNSFDSRLFWGVLYATPLLWTFFFLTAMLWLQFQCFVTLVTALVLSCSNVYGYYKCSADQRQKVAEWMNSGVEMGVGAMMRGGMLGRLFGGVRREAVPTVDTLPGTFA
ncbi:hypothetical protein HJC23_005351 [Cyclotella cryptica]|uniref:Golgi apparatus membrane protein TVP23 homolog n=1 Tax=Cyclotella cryptica TaxID=29204 RepID=A0ABD3PEZ6_9STRA|eukprot:CCRYP_015362-RA/>CCRYP_015362-RA protein AED:0.21 eAED:0.21 QI:0/-1/0/1/-1/1/1/0/274